MLKQAHMAAGIPDAEVGQNGAAGDNGNLLTGFENLEEILSPETAASAKAAAAAANGGPAGDDAVAPAAGVSLLGGLVNAKSKASAGTTLDMQAFCRGLYSWLRTVIYALVGLHTASG